MIVRIRVWMLMNVCSAQIMYPICHILPQLSINNGPHHPPRGQIEMWPRSIHYQTTVGLESLSPVYHVCLT